MKIEELMIGDYITFRDVQNDSYCPKVKVCGLIDDDVYASIDGDPVLDIVDPDDIAGIPLTPEILEKNGFTKSEKFDVWKIISDDYELRITPWRVAVIFLDEDGSDKEEFSAPRPKYVNELQHALRLCGIEKEINVN